MWNALENALKMGLRVQMDAKSGQSISESKSEIFSGLGDAQESVNGKTVNVFDVRLVVHLRMLLIIHWELHLKVHFKIYTKVRKMLHLRLD